MPYVCDGNSAGVLVFDAHGRVLLGERAKPPSGIAPPCGHVTDTDPHRTHRQAACDETWEEYGLTVHPENLKRVYSRWQPNRCGAAIPAAHGGHRWEVYRTDQWTGAVVFAPDEVSGYGWYTLDQVQRLADRTIAYAHGRIPDRDWQANPGLEPVWVDILQIIPHSWADLEDTYIRVPDPRDRRAVDALYTAT